MNSRVTAILGIAAALVVCLILWQGGGAAGVPAREADRPEMASGTDTSPSGRPAPRADSAHEAVAQKPADPLGVEGRVFVLVDGEHRTGPDLPANVTVSLRAIGGEDPARRHVLVSEDGSFSIGELVPGRYELKAVADGHTQGAVEVIEVGAGVQPRKLVLFLSRGASLGVQLLDSRGIPVPSARVVIARWPTRTAGRTGLTDADGWVRFAELDPGMVEIETAHGGVDGRRTVLLGSDRLVEIRLNLGAVLSGVVVADGEPVSEALLELMRVETAVAAVTTLADASGRYEIAQLALGTYDIVLREKRHGGFSAWGGRVEIQSGSAVNHAIVLNSNRIRGRVTLSDTGEAPRPFTVRVVLVSRQEGATHLRPLVAWPDNQGLYEFRGVSRGEYTVIATPNNDAYRRATRAVSLQAVSQFDGVDIQLERREYGFIELVVVDADGVVAENLRFRELHGKRSSSLQPFRSGGDGPVFRLETGRRRVAVYRGTERVAAIDLVVSARDTIRRTVRLPRK